MILATFYGIRHKPTGHFLPDSADERYYINTQVEPTMKTHPKMFKTWQEAETFLFAWSLGEFPYNNGFPILFFKPHRKAEAEDMEIVKLELTYNEP